MTTFEHENAPPERDSIPFHGVRQQSSALSLQAKKQREPIPKRPRPSETAAAPQAPAAPLVPDSVNLHPDATSAVAPSQSLQSKEMPTLNLYKTSKGLFWIDQNNRHHWVSDPIDVVAKTRDASSGNWGLQLQFVDPDGKQKAWEMPMALLASNRQQILATLLSLGLRVAPGTRSGSLLLEYIQLEKPDKRIRTVYRVGWFGSTFVLPETIIGNIDGEEIRLQGLEGHGHAYRCAGSLDSWQQSIGTWSIGNSRLLFAISAGFAPVLLPIVSMESGGFHFRGTTSSGKTTSIRVGASVWGGPGDDYISSWHATANGIEAVANRHNNSLLALDEMGQASAADIGSVIYMLGNEKGKVRANKDASERRSHEWKLIYISSGEDSLAGKMLEAGRKPRGGQEARLAEIPSDAGHGLGTWEELHGFPDAGEFSNALRAAADKDYGHPAMAYISGIIELGSPETKHRVAEHMESFKRQFVPPEASGEVIRVAARFALVAAAGELAAELGVVPWPEGAATEGVGTCFEAWAETRGGFNVQFDIEAAIQQVREFIATHGQSRFGSKDSSLDAVIYNMAGYLHLEGEHIEYQIFADVFQSAVCKGYDHVQVARALRDRGYLLVGEKGHLATKVRTPRLGRIRMYRISNSIFDV